MWNCTVDGNASTSDYKGFAPICDNIISFLLYTDQAPATYVDLIRENRALFVNLTNAPDNKTPLVEPRELLSLVNQINLSSRMYFMPRPFKRSGHVEMDVLFFSEEGDTLSCIFCGSTCRYVRNRRVVKDLAKALECERKLRRLRPRARNSLFPRARVPLSHIYYERMDPLHPIPSAADQQQHQQQQQQMNNNFEAVRVKNPKQFHFQDCPLVWLEMNCRWNGKHVITQIVETSKFFHAIQMMQFNIPLATEIEWNAYMGKIINSPNMGSCEDTLIGLFSRVIDMKLRCVNSRKWDIFQRPLFSMYYAEQDGQRHCPLETDNNSKRFLDRLLCFNTDASASAISSTEASDIPNSTTYTLNTEEAWKTLLMHGFCVQYKIKSTLSYHQARTICESSKSPFVEMVCMYCGMNFDCGLCNPLVIQKLYSTRDQMIILEYVQNPVSLSSDRRWRYHPSDGSSSIENAMAYHRVEEVLSSTELYNRIVQKGKGKENDDNGDNDAPLSYQETTILWLSASLDITHSPLCIFRYKKPIFTEDKCPVCMNDTPVSLFNCGHALCNTCINDIRITNCPVCKIGTRKFRLEVQDD